MYGHLADQWSLLGVVYNWMRSTAGVIRVLCNGHFNCFPVMFVVLGRLSRLWPLEIGTVVTVMYCALY